LLRKLIIVRSILEGLEQFSEPTYLI
jgi:hypothetical protein